MAKLRATPEIITKTKFKVTEYLFWFYPWKLEDVVERVLHFDRVLNQNIKTVTEKIP